MADIKIDEELLLRAGLGIGYAFAPIAKAVRRTGEEGRSGGKGIKENAR